MVREIQNRVYAKRQTSICTTWLSFLFICRLLLIIVYTEISEFMPVSSLRIVIDNFYPLVFLNWEITDLNLTFAVSRKRDSKFLKFLNSKIRQSRHKRNSRWLKTQGHFTNYVSFGIMCLLVVSLLSPGSGLPIGSALYFFLFTWKILFEPFNFFSPWMSLVNWF